MDNRDGRVAPVRNAGPMTAATDGPAWTAPGYEVVQLLGFGASGEVWLARESATGEPVALKRLRTPRDLVARDRLRREAAVLACVDHPHVVRLRTLVSAGDELVLVLDHAAGGSLAGVLAARRLDAGEIVTVAVPLAEALAAVHVQGLVHGDLTPANVLFTADGRPLLSDLGVCRLVGEQVDGSAGTVSGTPGYLDPAVLGGSPPGAAADVHGLGAVCYAALTGDAPYTDGGQRRPRLGERLPAAPPALVAAIEAALHPDPHRRPGAAELATALFAACPALPVGLAMGSLPAGVTGRPGDGFLAAVRPRDPVTHEMRVIDTGHAAVSAVVAAGSREEKPARLPRHGRRLPRAGRFSKAVRWRVAAGAAVVLCGLSMAVLMGLVWAGTDGRGSAAAIGPPARPLVAPAAKPVDWAGVLGRLDQARSAAFAEGDPALLADVYAPGSPALRRDQDVLMQLRAADHTTRGVRLESQSVQVVNASSRGAVLEVVDVMPAYELVAADGSVTSRRPGRTAARWSVTLTLVDKVWRVLDVSAVPHGQPGDSD